MIEKRKNYLNILRLELEDLHEDIDKLISECDSQKNDCRITNYVYMENLANLKNEILGLDVFSGIIDGTDPGRFNSLDEMIVSLKAAFSESMAEYGIINAIRLMVERKMEKVKKYVMQ